MRVTSPAAAPRQNIKSSALFDWYSASTEMALTSNRMILLFSFHLVAISSRIALADDGNFSWLNSNFPIYFPLEDNTNKAIIIAAGNLSEQCLQDTRLQLDALRADLSWAVESM